MANFATELTSCSKGSGVLPGEACNLGSEGAALKSCLGFADPSFVFCEKAFDRNALDLLSLGV